MKTRQKNIPEETEKQGNPALSLHYSHGLCYLQNVKHNLCVSHCANVSIWQECTTYPRLVWASGTLAFSKEPQVLCHINKWQLWKWIHFKRTCQPETCPLCKKTFQNIFRLISSLNFPHHSWYVISVSFKLALLWRIHTHIETQILRKTNHADLQDKTKPGMCHNWGKAIKRNQLKPEREGRKEC